MEDDEGQRESGQTGLAVFLVSLGHAEIDTEVHKLRPSWKEDSEAAGFRYGLI